MISAGIGDGCYAFGLQMPRSLLDGEVHELEVVEEDTGFALSEPPIRWRSAAGTAGTALTGIGAEMRDLSAGSLARSPEAEAERPPTAPRAQ